MSVNGPLPPAGVRGPVPALQRDRGDVVAGFVVEEVEVGFEVAGPDLGRGPSEVEQAVVAVVEHGHGPPSLSFGFRLVEHARPLLGQRLRGNQGNLA